MRPPVDPILIQIGPNFAVHWYGVLLVLGIILGAYYAARRAAQDGENPDHVWNALLLAVVLGIIGARLYHVFSEPSGGSAGWSYYRENPLEILNIKRGGLGIYGAIAGGALGAIIYALRAGLRPLQWLDYGAPGLALGQALGRWGNFINQELYGPPTNLPFGVVIDEANRIAPYRNMTLYPPDTLFHATFLYESLWCLVVFVSLALISKRLKRRLRHGDILLGYLILYPLGRFFIEYLRPDAWMVGPIAAAQLFALLLIVGATIALVARHLSGRRGGGPAASEAQPAAESSS
jgi:phosphatidylglycerol:prolipoprotein diacylglycerol transferase